MDDPTKTKIKRDRIEKLDEKINWVSEDKNKQIKEIQKSIKKNADEFNALLSRVEIVLSKSKQIEESSDLIETFDAQISALKEKTQKLESAAKYQNKVNKKYDKNFEDNSAQHEAIDNRLKTVEEFNNGESGRLEALYTRINNETNNKLKTLRENIQSQMNSLKEELNVSITNSYNSTKDMIKNNSQKITEQTARIDKAVSDITTCGNNIVSIQKYLESVAKQINAHNEKLGQHDNFLTVCKDHIEVLEKFSSKTTSK